MSKLKVGHTAEPQAAGADDVARLLGDLDVTAMSDILSLKPNMAELEEAAVRALGDGDVLGKSGKPMTARIAQIIEIMNPDVDDER
jgi:hypothetical protein